MMSYIRTDRNGTKIYHDWTCPRCGGAGQADKWIATGKICYECGGTGKRRRPLIVKEYEPEYLAKLEARRAEKAAKYAEEHADEIAERQAEQERREKAWREREEKRTFENHGCGQDGVGYVLLGKTYPIKDKIKANGGKWIYGAWVCPVEIKATGVKSTRIDLNDCRNEYGTISEYDANDMIWEAQQE